MKLNTQQFCQGIHLTKKGERNRRMTCSSKDLQIHQEAPRRKGARAVRALSLPCWAKNASLLCLSLFSVLQQKLVRRAKRNNSSGIFSDRLQGM